MFYVLLLLVSDVLGWLEVVDCLLLLDDMLLNGVLASALYFVRFDVNTHAFWSF